jgi:hypothetical protein
MPQTWIDISVPVRGGMVHWPGDPEVKIKNLLQMSRGDVCRLASAPDLALALAFRSEGAQAHDHPMNPA